MTNGWDAGGQNREIIFLVAGWGKLSKRLWADLIVFSARGGEAKACFDAGSKSVIKINDSVYYTSWLKFLSIVIHNLLFPNTVYTFPGFIEIEDAFQAMLKQPFFSSDDAAICLMLKKLMAHN